MPQVLMLSSRTMTSVALLSAGNDQAAVCNPVVYLEATAIGDLTGHTTEWVQLNGTPVVELFKVTDLRSYYLVPGLPGSDKTFRFYIDRGTGFEQYRDITIRTTPVSLAGFGENGAATGFRSDPSYAFVQAFRSVLLAPFNFTIPFNSIGAVVTGTAVLSYGLPELYYQTQDTNTQSFANRFVNTVVDKWNGVTWVNQLTATLTQARDITLNDGDRIRIGATYRTPSGVVTNYSQWYDFTASVVSGSTVINTIENGGATGVTSVTRTVFQLVMQNYSENISQLENGAAQGSAVTVRIVYILVPQTYDENINMLENGGATGKYSITRVSGGTIGG